jgi:uncharacterized protein (TIGR02594 family)
MKSAFVALLAVFALVLATDADAKPRKRHHYRAKHIEMVSTASYGGCDENSGRICQQYSQPMGRSGRKSAKADSYPAFDGMSGLVARARAYMGTNPTGWRGVWCGKFMEMIAPSAASRISNPALARNWIAAGPRVPCSTGTVAVLSRGRRGGHVGVVSGVDAHGNLMIVSGNHNRVVGEGLYSRGRVIGCVMV